MKALKVKKQNGTEINVLFSTNAYSNMPHGIGGSIINVHKIWDSFENNETVEIEEIGKTTIKKVGITFLESGKMYINI